MWVSAGVVVVLGTAAATARQRLLLFEGQIRAVDVFCYAGFFSHSHLASTSVPTTAD